MLSRQYPDLAQFVGAWFPDAEYDTADDSAVARRFSATTSERTLATVLEQGKRLLSREDLPWQELGREANRYFRSRDEARAWLREVVRALAER